MSTGVLLSGAISHDRATVTADTGAPSTSCRLAYSTDPGLGSPSYSGAVVSDSDGYARFTVTGLSPDTRYHYGIEIADMLDAARGTFKTFVPDGTPCSFVFAHATCTSYYDSGPSNHRVYDSIRVRAPLMFWMGGDEGYPDIATANPSAMRAALASSLRAPRAKAMHAAVPHAYQWDDHDFGPDNSDGTFVGKSDRAAVYRQMFPHYELPDANAVYQAWTIGRVRFIQTDLRYYRSPNSDPDGSSKTMLGATQKAWFKNELLAARDNLLTVWLNTQVWAVPTGAGDGDHWGSYATERTEISNWMAANGITNVIQLTGDQHALAIRRHCDFSGTQTAPMRIYSGAPLDAMPGSRNGGWDEVADTERGQYGTLTVVDDGNALSVLWEGWRTDPVTGAETLIMSDAFTRTYPTLDSGLYVVDDGAPKVFSVDGVPSVYAVQ